MGSVFNSFEKLSGARPLLSEAVLQVIQLFSLDQVGHHLVTDQGLENLAWDGC